MRVERLATFDLADLSTMKDCAELVVCPGCSRQTRVNHIIQDTWEVEHHAFCNVLMRSWASGLWAIPFYTPHVEGMGTVEVSRHTKTRLLLYHLLIPTVLRDFSLAQLSIGRMGLLAGPGAVPAVMFDETPKPTVPFPSIVAEANQKITFQVVNTADGGRSFGALLLVEIR